ncbi:hypothetical protein D3C75_823810 [compost metagenome]
MAGFLAAITSIELSMPPTAKMTMTGVRISAKIIRLACTVSVQLTARNPPIKVYRMVAAAPAHSAVA